MPNNDKYEDRKRESERTADLPVSETPLTRDEVQSIVNSLVGSIKAILDSFQENFVDKNAINIAYNNIMREIAARGYINKNDAKNIANDAVPVSLRGLDADVLRKYGTTLRLVSGVNGDQADWGLSGGFAVEGDKVLSKGVFLREYDADGVIVAAGSDINPADYATQALYDAALTAAGHTLKPTWDSARSGTDITP